GKAISMAEKYAPRLTDKVMEWTMPGMQRSDEPARDRDDNGLFNASGGLRERGGYPGHVAESSIYTKASLHPLVTGVLLLGVGAVAAALWRGTQSDAARLSNGGKMSR
ncbi:MAG: hypothetical protein LC754_19210, partial [Acidobacteria bacterium]|nr:hypothetical protein [Acidobacteriota bacterium]